MENGINRQRETGRRRNETIVIYYPVYHSYRYDNNVSNQLANLLETKITIWDCGNSSSHHQMAQRRQYAVKIIYGQKKRGQRSQALPSRGDQSSSSLAKRDFYQSPVKHIFCVKQYP
ncbi:hypothetical protein AVEN_11922-1 [Araneus ventricosus]|uniref:Uncharacterized protein n=1 Tax=Araneus ventricosus TaxID=182803 RepID=A0A4Y2EVU5_ARAVE|nr:hypothetical protein AVEN_11922-1 [Araneus ventricosus]